MPAGMPCQWIAWRGQVHRPGLIQLLGYVLLSGIIVAACSGLDESARYKSQAEQFIAENRLAEAVLAYRQALISDPENPDLLSGLGMALAAQGRNRSAARSVRRRSR